MARYLKSRSETASLVSEPGPETVERIRAGMPWTLAERLRMKCGLTDERFAALLGVSPRTLTRCRRSRSPLDTAAGDQLYRLMRIVELASFVFNDEAAGIRWLSEPRRGLGMQVPLELLDTEPGFHMVETLLKRIHYGVIM